MRRDDQASSRVQYDESLTQRAAAAFRGTQVRLCGWAVALVFGSTALQTLLSASPELSGRLAGLSTGVLTGSMSLAGSVCYLVRFALTGRWRYAYVTAAFWTVACGEGLRLVVGPAGGSALESSAWIIAGALFVMSRRVPGTTRQGRRLRTIRRLATIGMTTTALPLISSLCIVRVLFLTPNLLSALALAAAGSVILAMVQCCRRQPDEKSPGVIPYFLAACALSLAYRAMAVAGLVEVSAISDLLGMVSWIVLASGFGIEVATGQAEITSRLEELETMHQVSWSVVGTRDAFELLSVFASTLREKLDAGVVCVYLAGANNETLKVAAAYGSCGPCDSMGKEYPIVSTSRFPGFHTGHSAKAFTTGEVQIARDVFVEVELVPWRIIGRDDGCAISLPLTDEEGTLGVLALYFHDHNHLTQSRIKLLTTLASAAAPAIRNANEAYVTWLSADGDSGDGLKWAA